MGLENCGIFLDISKAFDKVWYDGPIKLRRNGIYGETMNTLEDFRSDKKQRVVLNGQCLSWTDIRAGVSQGSILEPLLFLICINDLSDDIKSKCELFADDTSLFSVVMVLTLIMILRKLVNGLFSGKWSLTQIPPNRLKE